VPASAQFRTEYQHGLHVTACSPGKQCDAHYAIGAIRSTVRQPRGSSAPRCARAPR